MKKTHSAVEACREVHSVSNETIQNVLYLTTAINRAMAKDSHLGCIVSVSEYNHIKELAGLVIDDVNSLLSFLQCEYTPKMVKILMRSE